MEMVLQQRSIGGGGVAACQMTGPRPAATAPMMAKQEQREGDEQQEEQQRAGAEELRRGPWTVDEDLTLINYIADHGEGRWNALARAAGLKRTGKSCRLRWLNYLRPDVKRGDFTADEQLLILDLHSRWGNRWSKIAAQLPGRTDNEIKNYWRTRVQKHAKQLNCDVNSNRFKDAMRFIWMPRLAERAAVAAQQSTAMLTAAPPYDNTTCNTAAASSCSPSGGTTAACSSSCSSLTSSDSAAAADHPVLAAATTAEDDWAAMQQQDHEFWSPASALQHLTAGDRFQQADDDAHDLTGWVQGFSDGILSSSAPENNLWSLDDIWRMQ